eukprot:gene9228-1314_t
MEEYYHPLPDEVLQEIFSFSPLSTLLQLSLVSKSWYELLMKNTCSTRIWRNLSYKAFKNSTYIDKETQKKMNFEDWKFLSMKLNSKKKKEKYLMEVELKKENIKIYGEEDESTFENSVILKAVEASTVDFSGQDLDQTRLEHSMHSFWSSKGSKSDESIDFGIYQLIRPKSDEFGTKNCVLKIDSLSLKIFQASWQDDNIYAPKRISLSFGYDKNCTEITTKEYVVEKINEIQNIEIGPLVLVWTEEYKKNQKSEAENSKKLEELLKVSDADILESIQGAIREDESIDYDIFYENLRQLEEKKRKLFEENNRKSAGSWFLKEIYCIMYVLIN